jgi:hypothetical protein
MAIIPMMMVVRFSHPLMWNLLHCLCGFLSPFTRSGRNREKTLNILTLKPLPPPPFDLPVVALGVVVVVVKRKYKQWWPSQEERMEEGGPSTTPSKADIYNLAAKTSLIRSVAF